MMCMCTGIPNKMVREFIYITILIRINISKILFFKLVYTFCSFFIYSWNILACWTLYCNCPV